MLNNLKVDIVYYKTNTDFEMEFNLCGCCRMRLLTDKSPTVKTMVNSLARAVSRSKIVILVGGLFGDEGTVKLVSQAIKYNTCIADNKTFGIKSEEQIEIIKGSVPLVTDDGFFGGIVIESGNQSIILVSENKHIRKSVMQSLVHPYIAELYANGVSGETHTSKHGLSENVPSANIIPEPLPEPIPVPETLPINAVPDLPLTEPVAENNDLSAEQTPETDALNDNLAETENEITDISSDSDTEVDKSSAETLQNTADEISFKDSNINVVSSATPLDSPSSFAFSEGGIVASEFVAEAIPCKSNIELDSLPPEIDRSTEITDYDTDDILPPNPDDLLPISNLTMDKGDDTISPEEKHFASLNIAIFVLTVILLVISAIIIYCTFIVAPRNGLDPISFIIKIFKTLFPNI